MIECQLTLADNFLHSLTLNGSELVEFSYLLLLLHSFGEHQSEKKFSNPDLKFPPQREKKNGSLFLKLSRKKNFRCKRDSVRKSGARKHLPKTTENFETRTDFQALVKNQNKTGPVMTNEGRQKDWKWKRK